MDKRSASAKHSIFVAIPVDALRLSTLQIRKIYVVYTQRVQEPLRGIDKWNYMFTRIFGCLFAQARVDK